MALTYSAAFVPLSFHFIFPPSQALIESTATSQCDHDYVLSRHSNLAGGLMASVINVTSSTLDNETRVNSMFPATTILSRACMPRITGYLPSGTPKVSS
jgi:hypothetical protein